MPAYKVWRTKEEEEIGSQSSRRKLQQSFMKSLLTFNRISVFMQQAQLGQGEKRMQGFIMSTML
ncbi:unnamed protein product [Sphagnum troendelagicum]|uniref:Uncharacterized protein n=1 Tax=Sphagnum troendelagicum TaxID=128251 RepID=A0ABP0U683_9BRYO